MGTKYPAIPDDIEDIFIELRTLGKYIPKDKRKCYKESLFNILRYIEEQSVNLNKIMSAKDEARNIRLALVDFVGNSPFLELILSKAHKYDTGSPLPSEHFSEEYKDYLSLQKANEEAEKESNVNAF